MGSIKGHLFTLIATIGIVVLSTIPIPEVPELEGVPLIDKWVHFVMYGGLVCAMWLDFYLRKNKNATFVFSAVSVLYSTALGGLMEIVQEYMTTCRNGDWIDFLADSVGVLIGFVLSFAVFKIYTRNTL